MNLKDFSTMSARLTALTLGSFCLVFSCGCGSIDSGAPTIDSFGTMGAMSGVVHGGQFPIYNATVNLYAAGTTGYGSAATLLATTTTKPDGTFKFTKNATGTPPDGSIDANWSCPTSNPDPQIYLTAVGGNTQGSGVTTTNNSASALIAAIGACSTVSTSTIVQLNELTTVATVFALAQYISPGTLSGSTLVAGTSGIGTNGANMTSSKPQGALGLNNAVAGIANLASISSGTAVTANTYTGTNTTVSGVIVTATPETAKLITVANILAACINSTSASSNQCADLFNNATPPAASVTSQPSSAAFVTAQDTIQAAYFMATNPTDAGTSTSCNNTMGAPTKIGCLFNLASSSPPFQTGLSTAPADWTISVSFQAIHAGSTTSLSSAGGSTVGAPTITPYSCSDGHYFLYGPQNTALDAYGNLWFTNDIQHTDNIAVISPLGKPLYCGQATSPYSPFGSGLTIDPSGNIWADYTGASSGTGLVYEIVSPGAVPTTTTTPLVAVPVASQTSVQTTSIVSDQYGNIFYSTYNGASLAAYEIPVGASTSFLVGSSLAATGTSIYATTDSVGRVYFGTNTAAAALVELTPPSSAITGYTISTGTPNSVTFIGANTFTAGQQVIIAGLTDASGTALNRQTLTLTAATPSTFTANTTVATTGGGVTDTGIAVVVPVAPTTAAPTSPYKVVINNLANATFGAAFDSNNNYYTGTSCCSTAGESLVKATISPAGTAITSAAGNYSYSAVNIGGNTGTRSVALDGAGNVWFGNEYASNDNGSAESPTSTTGIYSIGEASSSGTGSTVTFTALSPAPTGLVGSDACTTGTGCSVGGGFQKTSFGYTPGIAIDASGNVWAPNYNTAGYLNGGYGDANIVMVVGAAVPVATPLSVGSANGTLAAKP
jgi:hypothetical protein